MSSVIQPSLLICAHCVLKFMETFIKSVCSEAAQAEVHSQPQALGFHLCGRAEAVLAHIHLDLWAAPKKSCPHALEPQPSGPSPQTGGCRGGAQIGGPRLQTVASSCPAPPPPHTSTVHRGSPPGWADAMMDILGFFRVSSWKNKGQGLDDVGMCNLRQEASKWDRRAGVSPADHCQAACGV